MDYLAIILISAVALAIVAPMVVGIVSGRRRTRALKTLASQLGFGFVDEVNFSGKEELQTFRTLLPQNGAFGDVMEGEVSGLRVLLFDWVCKTGQGRHARTRLTTAAAFSGLGCDLPRFELNQKRLITTRPGRIELQKPSLSEKLVLTSEDAAGVRSLYTSEVCDFLATAMSDKKWRIAGHRNWLVICQSNKRLSPAKWGGFLTSASEVASRFLSSLRATTNVGGAV